MSDLAMAIHIQTVVFTACTILTIKWNEKIYKK